MHSLPRARMMRTILLAILSTSAGDNSGALAQSFATAVQQGSVDGVLGVLGHDASLASAALAASGATAMHVAAARGHIDMMRVLLAHDARVDVRTSTPSARSSMLAKAHAKKSSVISASRPNPP